MTWDYHHELDEINNDLEKLIEKFTGLVEDDVREEKEELECELYDEIRQILNCTAEKYSRKHSRKSKIN